MIENYLRCFQRSLLLLMAVLIASCDRAPYGVETTAGSSNGDIRRDATVNAIERAIPCVVNIATTQLVRRDDSLQGIMRRRFFGLSDGPEISEKLKSVGSGVIIDASGDEGFILTNLHVVEEASRIQVQLVDGRVYEAKPLLSTSHKDLALLRIVRKSEEKPFIPAALAKDDDLLLGETVIAIGNPFGFGVSVSRGILSSKNRRAAAGTNELRYEDWLQTDANINPGNSGGPLINLRGELIGMNVAIYEEGEGHGASFAIPVKQIAAALSDFFSLEFSADLWLGARFRGAPYPLTVREVQPTSPADRAGLRVGQEVVEVNGKPVKSLVNFNTAMAVGSNNQAEVTVIEKGSRKKLHVEMLPMTELNQQLIRVRLGMSTKLLTEQQSAAFQIKPGDALLVSEIESNSPAALAQFRPGILIAGINGKPVSERVAIANLLGNKRPGEIVQVSVVVPRTAANGQTLLQPEAVNLLLR